MWALIVDGSINRFFKVPTAFKHPTTGNQYPRNWITLATDSEKAAIGLIEVTYSGSHGVSEYYIRLVCHKKIRNINCNTFNRNCV